MSIIQFENLTFSYSGYANAVFDHVSLAFDTSWKTGLIGRNGTGKSTLFKLLMGEEKFEGTLKKSAECLRFPFTVEDPAKPAIEVFYELDPYGEEWKLFRECSLLGLDAELLYRPFETLSKGEQTKVLLAILFTKEHDFLLIDEPTNHLDIEGRQLVSEYLKQKDGFLLISHDRDFLDACIDHVISFNRTTIEVQQGNFSSWYVNRQRQDQYEQVQNDRLRKDIKRLKEASRQSKSWSDRVESTKNGTRVAGLKPDKGRIGHKAAKMMQKAKNLENRQNKAISDKEKLLKDVEKGESLKLQQLPHFKDVLIEGHDISASYSGKPVFENLDFVIRRGERTAIQGANGSGKSTLLKVLIGQPVDYTGTLEKASDLQISWIPQDASHLSGSLKDYLRQEQVDETLCMTILRKLDFSREHFSTSMDFYSEGQKKKVLLAVSLSRPAHLFVWDEPLNYIDVISRIQIEQILEECRPTLVFVEHDKRFTENIATQIIHLK